MELYEKQISATVKSTASNKGSPWIIFLNNTYSKINTHIIFKYCSHNYFCFRVFKTYIQSRINWEVLKEQSKSCQQQGQKLNHKRGSQQWLIFHFRILRFNFQIIIMDIHCQVALGPIIKSSHQIKLVRKQPYLPKNILTWEISL